MSNAATQDSLDVMAPVYTTPAPTPAVDPDVIVQYGTPEPKKKPAASQQVINITSQEQFDALPDYQKEIIRAEASGATISQKSQEQLTVDAINRNLEPESVAGTITLEKDPVTGEEIRIFNSSDGSAYPMAPPAPTKYDTFIRDDGTVMNRDPYTGRAFPAWDGDTGQSVRARVGGQNQRNDPGSMAMAATLNAELMQANSKIASLTARIAGGDTKDGWFGSPLTQLLAAEVARKQVLEEQLAQNGQSSSIEQAPMPSDMPSDMPASPQQISAPSSVQENMTPRDPQLADSPAYTSAADVRAAFLAGKIPREEAVRILQTQFNY